MVFTVGRVLKGDYIPEFIEVCSPIDPQECVCGEINTLSLGQLEFEVGPEAPVARPLLERMSTRPSFYMKVGGGTLANIVAGQPKK